MAIPAVSTTDQSSIQALTRFSKTVNLQSQSAQVKVSSNFDFSNSDKALELVYQAALDKLNEILLPELGEAGLQGAYDAGIDVSPEATAGRIVSLSTGLLGRYLDANPGKELDETFTNFLNVIKGGIEQGFNEARDILASLDVLNGNIATNIDSTYELVQEGLDAFEIEFRNTQGLTTEVVKP